MRATKILSLVMTLCLMVSCSQEERLNHNQNQEQSRKGITSLTVNIEGTSRSAVDDGGVFSWTEGDTIWAWDGTEGLEFIYDVDTKEFKGYAEQLQDYAVYPYNENHLVGNDEVKVNMPNHYFHGSTNAIMLAEVNPQNPTNLTFKHLGGVMRFTVKDVPAGATAFVFTAIGKSITGEFTVTEEEGEKIIKAGESESSSNVVTIGFNELATPQDMVFYIPMPVGEYEGYQVAVKKGENEVISDDNASETAMNIIKRRSLLLMPEFTCSENSIIKGTSNTVTLEAQEQTLNISGDTEKVLVKAPVNTAADGTKAVLNLNFTPVESESGTSSSLTISDGYGGPSTESEAEVVVTMPESESVPDLNIETPTLTVVLASGSYGTVTAKTATETLIIKSGVKIENLQVQGGKVEVESGAEITESNYDESNEDSDISNLDELKAAFQAGGIYKLSASLTITESLTVSEDLSLDFNGHTLEMGSYTMTVADGKTLALSNPSSMEGGATGSGDIITASKEAKIYIGRNVNLTSSENCCIFIPRGAENVTVETAGNLETTGGDYASLYVNGSVGSGNIRVKGGSVEHIENTAIYAAGNVNLTIEGDTRIKGKTGVEIRAGRLDIYGGIITATGNPFDSSSNNNGSTSDGAAVAICQHTTNLPLYANIYGGTFEGERSLYEEDLEDSDVAAIGLNVKGGTFKGEIFSENCTGFIHGGTFVNCDVMKYWADGAVITMAKGEYLLPAQLNPGEVNKPITITIKGEGTETVLKGATNSGGNPGNYAHYMHLRFENLKYVTSKNGYNGGFGHAASVGFKNCTIEGQFYAHSDAPHTFTGCIIDPCNGYLYTYASDCTFTGCTFNASEGKALQIYEDGSTGENKVVITGCSFSAAKQAQTWDGKPVTGIDINSIGAKFHVIITDCTTEGFPVGQNSNSDLYNIKGGQQYVTLEIDGNVICTAE